MPAERRETEPLAYETPHHEAAPSSHATTVALVTGVVGVVCVCTMVAILLAERYGIRLARWVPEIHFAAVLPLAWLASVFGLVLAGYALGDAPSRRAGVAVALNAITFLSPLAIAVAAIVLGLAD